MLNVGDLLDEVGEFRDKFGKTVPHTGTAWLVHSMRVAAPVRLDFAWLANHDRESAVAFVLFIREQLQVNGVEHARSCFRVIRQFLKSSGSDCDDFFVSFFAFQRELREKNHEYTLHYVRDWYVWCSDQLLDGFGDSEAYWAIRETIIPGNAKGQAVMSQDPERGPLFEIEETALRGVLERTTALDVRAQALAWIFLDYGPNPLNVALLRESDFTGYAAGRDRFFQLDMPRIKKRVVYRGDFKPRKVEPFLGEIILALIEENRRQHPLPAENRPLFWARHRRQDLGEWDEYAWHTSAADLSNELREIVERLNITSPVTSQPMRVTPRRLRYTFATRMVRQGCDEERLAELLDHTDTQHVLVYYKNKDAQKRLDDALNEQFAPVADRFAGRIVANEAEAGGNPSTRIKSTISLLDLGTCGLDAPCDKAIPFGCYVCPKFMPWADAPHERFMQEVREIAKGPREAVQMNAIVAAISQVIDACKSV